jgi:hypothetical protein
MTDIAAVMPLAHGEAKAELPLNANVPFMTIMAAKIPGIARA